MQKIHLAGLIIELTNICNLSCPLCATGAGIHNRPKGQMSLGKFKRLIDTVSPFLENVSLWGWGEPFLIKQLPFMIQYANQKGLSVWVSTNLTILSDEMLKQLIGLKFKLILSIDGLCAKTYGKYRVGANFKTVLKNLLRLTSEKKRKGARNPYLIWQFIVMKHNEHETKKVVSFARRYGVDEVWHKAVLPAWAEDPMYLTFKPEAKIYQNQPLYNSNGRLRCYVLEQYPFVFWNGDVVPCAFDSKGDFLMGNLFKNNLETIWRSRQFEKFRKDFEQERIFMCQRCGGRDPKSENLRRTKLNQEK